MGKFAKGVAGALIGFAAINLALIGITLLGPVGAVIAAGAVTYLSVNAAIKITNRALEKKEHPQYKYQVQDGSTITVEPTRQRVTRRLSNDFARVADFKQQTVSDLVKHDDNIYSVYSIPKKAWDIALSAQFNRHSLVNTKTMEKAREYDQGATEVFVMEKYLKHAQEQYAKDLALKSGKPQNQKPQAAQRNNAPKNA